MMSKVLPLRRLIMLGVAACFALATVASGQVATAEPAGGSAGWRTLTSLPGVRQEHGVAALDGKVYAVAGITPADTGGVENTGRVEAYDPRMNSWTETAPLPLPMNHPNVAAVRGKLYVVGGMVGAGPWTAVPNVFEYDPHQDAWQELAPMPAGTERGSAAVGVRGTKIYLAGGLRSLTPGPGGFQDTVATFSAYDVVSGAWEALPNLPEPRDHVDGALVGGTFYALGGRVNGIENIRGTVFGYHLATGRWSTLAPMPTPRGGVATAAVGTKIYVIGGEGNPTPDTHGVFGDNEVYDTTTNSWRALAPMPTPRHGTGAATVGSTVYVPGGGDETMASPVDINEAFRPR